MYQMVMMMMRMMVLGVGNDMPEVWSLALKLDEMFHTWVNSVKVQTTYVEWSFEQKTPSDDTSLFRDQGGAEGTVNRPDTVIV